jgi:hypothetical protein
MNVDWEDSAALTSGTVLIRKWNNRYGKETPSLVHFDHYRGHFIVLGK